MLYSYTLLEIAARLQSARVSGQHLVSKEGNDKSHIESDLWTEAYVRSQDTNLGPGGILVAMECHEVGRSCVGVHCLAELVRAGNSVEGIQSLYGGPWSDSLL